MKPKSFKKIFNGLFNWLILAVCIPLLPIVVKIFFANKPIHELIIDGSLIIISVCLCSSAMGILSGTTEKKDSLIYCFKPLLLALIVLGSLCYGYINAQDLLCMDDRTKTKIFILSLGIFLTGLIASLCCQYVLETREVKMENQDGKIN